MVDRCLSPLMPGVTCDRNRMLSHVVTMVMVAKMLPVGFNISTCGKHNLFIKLSWIILESYSYKTEN